MSGIGSQNTLPGIGCQIIRAILVPYHYFYNCHARIGQMRGGSSRSSKLPFIEKATISFNYEVILESAMGISECPQSVNVGKLLWLSVCLRTVKWDCDQS